MESGFMMVIHAIFITIILYLGMKYGLGQNDMKSQNRSILIGAVVLIYMILFGHGLPTSINKSLF
jgi:hypothetical protein